MARFCDIFVARIKLHEPTRKSHLRGLESDGECDNDGYRLYVCELTVTYVQLFVPSNKHNYNFWHLLYVQVYVPQTDITQ